MRDIARENGLKFRMGVLRADIDKTVLKAALKTNGVTSIDEMPALNDTEIAAAAHIVGQMGMSALQRRSPPVSMWSSPAGLAIRRSLRLCRRCSAFRSGRPCTWPKSSNARRCAVFPAAASTILATLDHEGFELDSMAPHRCATPVSVAAHSLYEQSDPFAVYEPEGRLDLTRATYHAIDDRRTRVIGAQWADAKETWVKIEGSRKVGERAVLLCGTADPKFIAQQDKLLKEVEIVVRDLVCEDSPEDYVLTWRVYGIQGVRMTPAVVEHRRRKCSSWRNA